jgi:hypothetical protein
MVSFLWVGGGEGGGGGGYVSVLGFAEGGMCVG